MWHALSLTAYRWALFSGRRPFRSHQPVRRHITSALLTVMKIRWAGAVHSFILALQQMAVAMHSLSPP